LLIEDTLTTNSDNEYYCIVSWTYYEVVFIGLKAEITVRAIKVRACGQKNLCLPAWAGAWEGLCLRLEEKTLPACECFCVPAWI